MTKVNAEFAGCSYLFVAIQEPKPTAMKLNMKQYHPISRLSIYILALALICIGLFHLKNPYDTLVYVPSFLPGGITWAYLVGVCFIVVGISFLVNQYVKITSYLLAIFLVIFILTIHVPNAVNAGDATFRTFALINIMKDTAIAAFALHIAASAHHQHLHFEEDD
jgi:putative oxidoreductase